ncbi:MAG: hypothetical protein NVS2B16_22270 [Chloroflexota bacterium]
MQENADVLDDHIVFPTLLTTLCSSLAEAAHADSTALLLYDEIADAFGIVAVTGPAFFGLQGQSIRAQDANLLVEALEHGKSARRHSLAAVLPHEMVPPTVDVDELVFLLPLANETAVGVLIALTTHDLAASASQKTLTRLAREAAYRIVVARPDRAHDCLFRRVLEADPGGVAVVEGDDWVFSYASVGFRQIHGHSHLPFVGHCVADLLPDVHAHDLLTRLGSVRETGESRYATGVEVRDQFGTRYYDLHILPQKDASHHVVTVLIIFWARTDAYVTRQALQSTIVKLAESDSLLAAVLNASNSGIAFIDTDRVIAYANRRVAEFFGATVEDLIGHRADEIMSGHMAGRVRNADDFERRLRALYEEMEETSTDEVEVESPAHRILERYSAPVYGDTGTLLGRVEVYTDVTEVRQLQRNKDEFLSLVSHELRTPVTSVKGYAQLLLRRARKEQPSEQTLLAYETIERQTQRMQDLINLLLDLSRLDSGRLRLAISEINLNDLVTRAAEMVQMTSEKYSIVLRLPARAVWIEADEQRLEQALLNLLNNAVGYSALGSTVTVSLEVDVDEVRISVRDEGVGIPADGLNRIFERFYRADGVPESTGLGVGLYIARQIVERHGGSIVVVSEVGVGSTFTITLPMQVLTAPGVDGVL